MTILKKLLLPIMLLAFASAAYAETKSIEEIIEMSQEDRKELKEYTSNLSYQQRNKLKQEFRAVMANQGSF